MEIMVAIPSYNFHKSGMTTSRAFLSVVSVCLFTSVTQAAPPDDLTGRYVTLNGDRIELPTASAGSNGSDEVTYTYEVLSDLSASLVINYPVSSRMRNVTLSFLADGTAAGYQEFDFLSTNPPMPPMVRSGSFEIGLLEVAPPLESSAPASLTGSFLIGGGKRYEFLTSENGRLFVPGKSEYFTYDYFINDEVSSGATILFEGGAREIELVLTFDAEGNPVGYESTEFLDSEVVGEKSGRFETGVNRHLADLKIGTDALSLLGDDHFNALGFRQTTGKVSNSMKTIVYSFEVENDGDTDRIRLEATRARHYFKVEYFTRPGRENVTAAMTTGRHVTAELVHGEVAAYTMELTPLRETGAFAGAVTARSESVTPARDTVASLTLVKAKKKHSFGKSKSRGKGKSRR